LTFQGRPNRLSEHQVDWKIIYETAAKTRKPPTTAEVWTGGSRPFLETPVTMERAAAVIRRRRSATAYDPDGTVAREPFLAILDKTLPRDGCPPFDVGLGPPAIHLLLFVHAVTGMERGLYLLCRHPQDRESLTKAFRPEFIWTVQSDALPLFLLRAGDYRHTAIEISCHQEIAGFSAFSLAMLARYRDTVIAAPYRYRHLFWEAGLIGQVLYLEAEAHGLRGTGIGCYFDDPVHDLVGLKDDAWQSMYHFTVGRPMEDPRLATLPAYHHLKASGRDG
jgi:nitroreductase